MTTAKAQETRTIEVTLQGGRKTRVGNIPATAKITYGPVSPGTQRPYGDSGNCLRIYTSQQNQLAVFIGVQEFRDLSLTVERQVVRKDASEFTEKGPKGSKRTANETVELDWEKD